MKVFLWWAFLFSVFIGCIQAEKSEFAYQKNSPMEKDEKRRKQNIDFLLVRLRIINIVAGRTGDLGITHILTESLRNFNRNL